MNSQSNTVTPIEQTRRSRSGPVIRHSLKAPLETDASHNSEVDLSHPDMERRLSARQAWEFLGIGRSTFYCLMNPNDLNYYDPHFPRPIPSTTTGRGPRRWKLGALIAWLRLCESIAAGV